MKPWETLDRALAPGGGELLLQRRGDELALRAGGHVLMSSRVTGSEQALAELGCAGLRAEARVLVGGLGMGFTLRAALERLSSSARIEVAELVPAVVAWNRGPLAGLAGRPLEDPRVTVFEGDVRARWATEGALDAILLDVDNGPAALTRPGNAGLYRDAALKEIRRALRPKGVLALWSAGPDAAFTRRLTEAGFSPTAHPVGRGRHTVIVGVRR